MPERLVDMNLITEEEIFQEKSLRPRFLSDFTGQSVACSNLSVFIKASKIRDDIFDHVLLFGPPGLGKTTLAHIIANELGVDFKTTSAPILTKAGDLAAILTNLQPNSVFFIDEIHRLNPCVEETLYSAMEDFKIDIMIGEGASAKSLRLDLQPFTLVGATTRSGLIAKPLCERFGIQIKLQFYDINDLTKIVERAAKILNVEIDNCAAKEIARRSRGTPRIAGRLLRRVRDFAFVFNNKNNKVIIDNEIAISSLEKLEVDELGLDAQDIKYLKLISQYYSGGPVGVDTISSALAEEKDTIEEVIEPYLLQIGFIQKTPRGRVLTNLAYEHLAIGK